MTFDLDILLLGC